MLTALLCVVLEVLWVAANHLRVALGLQVQTRLPPSPNDGANRLRVAGVVATATPRSHSAGELLGHCMSACVSLLTAPSAHRVCGEQQCGGADVTVMSNALGVRALGSRILHVHYMCIPADGTIACAVDDGAERRSSCWDTACVSLTNALIIADGAIMCVAHSAGAIACGARSTAAITKCRANHLGVAGADVMVPAQAELLAMANCIRGCSEATAICKG
ncbi:hypothetical protein BC826DRAFT_975193 [Russula brevipes]|nr:hypothetical protein BC826DRAFT_975193 [Russula brevipes]